LETAARLLHSAAFQRDLDIGVRYNPITAADEKIPLSVVQVNNKPQHLVFCLHSRHLLSKQREMPVESSNGLTGRGFRPTGLP
jgi:hypothetical protein